MRLSDRERRLLENWKAAREINRELRRKKRRADADAWEDEVNASFGRVVIALGIAVLVFRVVLDWVA